MAPADKRPSTRRHRLAIALALVGAIVLLAATALHLVALEASRRAQAPRDLASREASARLAARIEPWNRAYRRRADLLELWAKGKELLDAGDYNGAVDALALAYANDVGNTELLALFQKAQATQALETNRKAHLQHGHEGPGGTLAPGDVER